MRMQARDKFLSAILTGAAVVGISFASQAAQAPTLLRATTIEATGRVQSVAKQTPSMTAQRASQSETGQALVSVIVKLDVDSVALAARKSAIAAGTPGANRRTQFDPRSGAAGRQFALLAAKQRNFAAAVNRSVPRARIVHDLSVVIGGVSVVVPESDVDALRQLPGVERVYRDQLLQPQTDSTPEFTGATELWSNGSAGRGADVVIGMLDTGVWPEHPSFSDPDPDGQPYPDAPAHWQGAPCEFGSRTQGDAAFTCNNKLIGARRFMDTYDELIGLFPEEFRSARDDDGHGTHTASIAAGNHDVVARLLRVSRGRISGIAPRAHLAIYKVCGFEGCFGSDAAAAVQQAILDGVDVLNFSISGGRSPYLEAVSLAFLDAYEAGIFVAASAGNAGPRPDSVGHREPWVTTVAASTEARQFLSTLTLVTRNGATFTARGASITAGITTPAPIIDAAAAPYNDPYCYSAPRDGAFAGHVVVCRHGASPIYTSFAVKRRGAVGLILFDEVADFIEAGNQFLPTVHLDERSGDALRNFLAARTNVAGLTATFTAGRSEARQPDVMAEFSSRGGPEQNLGISKPDVAAPGVEILAGQSPLAISFTRPRHQFFQTLSGTSMAAPHVAGAAALLKGLHPDWSPGQIKSALMLTASPAMVKEDGVRPTTPFDRGSGRIRIAEADNPGLSISAGAQDFIDHQADLALVNYPSLYVPAHAGIIRVRRTVHSELLDRRQWDVTTDAPADVTMHVSPSRFLLPAGGDLTLTITVNASRVPVGATRHANIHLSSGAFTADFPVTVIRQEVPLTFAHSCTRDRLQPGSVTRCSVSLANPGLEPASFRIGGTLPAELELVSLDGASMSDGSYSRSGTLAAFAPPSVTVSPGSLFGYVPLSSLGIEPVAGFTDDSIINFDVPAFQFGGESNTRIGVGSNGYVVVGGGTAEDVSYLNTNLPNPSPPNNLLAPFWTDLNPERGGSIRVGSVTNGQSTWTVIEWSDVPTFSTNEPKTFQVWIGISDDGTPEEDLTFAYPSAQGAGNNGRLTVGAENRFGNSGQAYVLNDTGPDQDLRVVSGESQPGGTVTITYRARGRTPGEWKSCARASSPEMFFGKAIACATGTVTQ